MTDIVETLILHFVFNTGVKRGAIIDLIKKCAICREILCSAYIVPFVITATCVAWKLRVKEFNIEHTKKSL